MTSSLVSDISLIYDKFNNDIKHFEVIYLLIKLYNQHSLIIKMSKLRSGMLAQC